VVRVTGLDPESRQADARFPAILEALGLTVRRGPDWIEVEGGAPLREVDVDLSDSPDLAPTMAVIGLFAERPSRLRGVAHLRVKESDRLAVLAENLMRLGRDATVRSDALEIGPMTGSGPRGATIATHSDHRIAMAFAVAGLRLANVTIDDAACVAKSNPRFWEDLSVLEG
jgi:3-phosphoshikimate 1-carboxyvinyltransferase